MPRGSAFGLFTKQKEASVMGAEPRGKGWERHRKEGGRAPSCVALEGQVRSVDSVLSPAKHPQ